MSKLKVMFVDEAQDLSPLQWKMYDLKSNSDDVYLAGDDDQAIYTWAGVDVNRFIKEPAKEEFYLNQDVYLKRFKNFLLW